MDEKALEIERLRWEFEKAKAETDKYNRLFQRFGFGVAGPSFACVLVITTMNFTGPAISFAMWCFAIGMPLSVGLAVAPAMGFPKKNQWPVFTIFLLWVYAAGLPIGTTGIAVFLGSISTAFGVTFGIVSFFVYSTWINVFSEFSDFQD